MVLEQMGIHMQKKNPDRDLTLFTKNNSTWIVDLNVKHRTIKLLEYSPEENLNDPGHGDDF